MSRAALRLVEKPEFSEQNGIFWCDASESEQHALHSAVSYPESFKPQLANYFIKRYSKPGDKVLDPFAGRGTTPLEAQFLQRTPLASDLNPLAVRLINSKLEPADISEVALRLQLINLRRPVCIDEYANRFENFFHLDTYRELIALRTLLKENFDRIARFIEFTTLGILHGHSAGYLSVYTFPQISVDVATQNSINQKRGQVPSYRALAPRVLRRAAQLSRDGLAPVNQRTKAKISMSDARNLSYLGSAEVDLIVTAPPRPLIQPNISDQWLRLWFLEYPESEINLTQSRLHTSRSIQEWMIFMNEVLFELARVTKKGGRAVFDLPPLVINKKVVELDFALRTLVEDELSRYWENETLIIQPRASQSVALRETPASKVLVLRRR